MAKGLGKGFDVLIPQDFDDAILVDNSESIQQLDVTSITPNPDQPRRVFDQTGLEELAASIKHYGILQPLIVSPAGAGQYQLVAGERRWRAAQLVELNKIPAIVRKREELERLEIALIENVQRVDLSPLEQAVSIERLHQQFNTTYQSIADRLGKALPTVHNLVRLLQLPPQARDALAERKISEGHARAILSLKDYTEQQTELLSSIVQKHWSVRQAEQFASSVKRDAATATQASRATKVETPETQRLGKRLETTVTVRRTAKGGRLEIHYASDEQLEALLKRFEAV